MEWWVGWWSMEVKLLDGFGKCIDIIEASCAWRVEEGSQFILFEMVMKTYVAKRYKECKVLSLCLIYWKAGTITPYSLFKQNSSSVGKGVSLCHQLLGSNGNWLFTRKWRLLRDKNFYLAKAKLIIMEKQSCDENVHRFTLCCRHATI